KTEIIVPAERFVPDDRDFNAWMKNMIGPADQSPLRWVGQWKDIGDLMVAPGMSGPYYAVHDHETDAGLLRVWDTERCPGFNIWGWGFPPSPKRQAEYTGSEKPNLGYIEIWNGTSRGFKDDALVSIGPGETWVFHEAICHLDGLNGESGKTPRQKIEALAHERLSSNPDSK
ncbi:MAG: hypothetical protein AAF492_20365, partial [Verrucomicrobiota bacterium]